MVDQQRLVFPVGQFGGMVRGEAPGEIRYVVRRGHEVIALPPDPGQLWLDAHDGTGTALAGRPGYAPLREAGLIAEVDPNGPADGSADGFARRHQLVPRAHGLGNRSTTPHRFLAAYVPDEVAMFTYYQWRLWRASHLEPSLWDGCRRLVAAEQASGYEVDLHELLAVTLRGLHVVIRYRLAHIDVARPTDGGPTDE